MTRQEAISELKVVFDKRSEMSFDEMKKSVSEIFKSVQKSHPDCEVLKGFFERVNGDKGFDAFELLRQYKQLDEQDYMLRSGLGNVIFSHFIENLQKCCGGGP